MTQPKSGRAVHPATWTRLLEILSARRARTGSVLSFVPPKAIRELRNLTRYRKAQLNERTREVQRLDKISTARRSSPRGETLRPEEVLRERGPVNECWAVASQEELSVEIDTELDAGLELEGVASTT